MSIRVKVEAGKAEELLRRLVGLIEQIRLLIPSLPEDAALKIMALLSIYDQEVVAAEKAAEDEKVALEQRNKELEERVRRLEQLEKQPKNPEFPDFPRPRPKYPKYPLGRPWGRWMARQENQPKATGKGAGGPF